VQSLVHSGLLERRQGSGTYVLAASELAGAVSRHMAAARRVDVLEVRRTLEAGAARLAAQRRTDEDATALQELLAGRTAARNGGDVDRLVAVDVALHRAIVRAARNPVLIELYDTLVLALAANVRHNVESRPLEQDDDHSRLIQAILDGDGERAADEAGRYLDGLISGC
jgi:DNA-binding FadR family transcriptional regulator